MRRLQVVLFSIFFLALPVKLVAQPALVLDPALSSQQEAEIRSVVGEVLGQYERRLNFRFKPNTVMVFSADPAFLARDYAQRTKSSYSRKLEAFESWIDAEAGYRRMHVNVGGQQWQRRENRQPLISHELFHILQYEIVGSRSRNCCQPDRVSSIGPTWLSEGSANYFERLVTGRDMNGYLRFSRQQVGNLRGRQLDVLETRDGMNSVDNSYEIGAYAVSLLVDEAGANSVFSFYQKLGRGQQWETAFANAFGQTADEFYASVR